MTEEAKELINCIRVNLRHNKCFGGIDEIECKLLLDCIANLQQELQKANDTIKELRDNKALELLKISINSQYINTQNENIRLNNIINEYENMKKELLDYIYHNEYCRFGHIDGGEADEMRNILKRTDKLKELKDSDYK